MLYCKLSSVVLDANSLPSGVWRDFLILINNWETRQLSGGYVVVQKLIQPSMEAEYILSGDRHHFLVHKAKLQAKYIFMPYGQEAGQISSHIV